MKKYIWLIYPVVVFFLIIFGINELQGEGSTQISKLLQKQGQTVTEEQKLKILTDKMQVLTAIDSGAENEKLTFAVRAVPAAKQVWVMMGEVENAASQAGVAIKKYSGSVGNVNEATAAAVVSPAPKARALVIEEPINMDVEMDVPEYAQLQKVVAVLEKSLPLVKINKIVYEKKTAKINITGAWAPWSKVSLEALTPLPLPDEKFNDLKTKLADFIILPDAMATPASGSAGVNPF